jgi:hypothetical protein
LTSPSRQAQVAQRRSLWLPITSQSPTDQNPRPESPAPARRIRFPLRPATLAGSQSPSSITCQSAPQRLGRRGEFLILTGAAVAVNWCSALVLPGRRGRRTGPRREEYCTLARKTRQAHPATFFRPRSYTLASRARGAPSDARVASRP